MTGRTLKTLADLPRYANPGQLHKDGMIGVSLSGKYVAVVSNTHNRNRLYHSATTVGWVNLPDDFYGDYEILSVSRDRVSVSGVYDPSGADQPKRYVFVFNPDGGVKGCYEDSVVLQSSPSRGSVYDLSLLGEEMPIYFSSSSGGWQFADRGRIPGHLCLATAAPDGSSIVLVTIPPQKVRTGEIRPLLHEVVVVHLGRQGEPGPFSLSGCSVDRLVLARFNRFRVQWIEDQPAIRFIECFRNDGFELDTREWFVTEDVTVVLDGADSEWTNAVFHNGNVYFIREDEGQSVLVRSGEAHEQLDRCGRIWNLRFLDGELTYNRIDRHSIQHVRHAI